MGQAHRLLASHALLGGMVSDCGMRYLRYQVSLADYVDTAIQHSTTRTAVGRMPHVAC